MPDADYPPRYLAGVLLFNRQDYFEAHEAWEDLWSEAHGDERRLYQGLIQAAVGLCHWCNGNRNGAAKLQRSSDDYLARCPSPMAGLDVAAFRTTMADCFAPLLRGEPAEIDPERLPEITLEPPPDTWPDPAEYVHEEADG